MSGGQTCAGPSESIRSRTRWAQGRQPFRPHIASDRSSASRASSIRPARSSTVARSSCVNACHQTLSVLVSAAATAVRASDSACSSSPRWASQERLGGSGHHPNAGTGRGDGPSLFEQPLSLVEAPEVAELARKTGLGRRRRNGGQRDDLDHFGAVPVCALPVAFDRRDQSRGCRRRPGRCCRSPRADGSTAPPRAATPSSKRPSIASSTARATVLGIPSAASRRARPSSASRRRPAAGR